MLGDQEYDRAPFAMSIAESFSQFTSLDFETVTFGAGKSWTGIEIKVSRLQIGSVIAMLKTCEELIKALVDPDKGLLNSDAGCHENIFPPEAVNCKESGLQRTTFAGDTTNGAG